MATARLYVFNGKAPKKEVKGQAAVILDVLKRQNGEPKLAADLAAQVEREGNLKTRQDILRVTLYYIIVFKNAGMILASDQDPKPTTDEAVVTPAASAEQPVAAE